MIKIKNIIIVVFISFFFIKCSNSQRDTNRSNINDFYNVEYKKSLKEFPDSLTKHFPINLSENIIFYNSSLKNKPKEFLFLVVVNKLLKSDTLNLRNKKYTSDTCIIKIYADRNYYGFDKQGLGECNSYIPVIDYSLLTYDNEKQKPDDFKYYVLETSHHVFINHKLYLRYYLPDEWKNGMSRGIAVSEKEKKIYYWLIMW